MCILGGVLYRLSFTIPRYSLGKEGSCFDGVSFSANVNMPRLACGQDRWTGRRWLVNYVAQNGLA